LSNLLLILPVIFRRLLVSTVYFARCRWA